MRNTTVLFSLALVTACATPSAAVTAASEPEDRRAVLATVQEFFDVIASGDAEAGARLVVPEGVFVNVRIEDGVRVGKHFSNADLRAALQ